MSGQVDATVDAFHHTHRDHVKDIHLAVLELRVGASTANEKQVSDLFEGHALSFASSNARRVS